MNTTDTQIKEQSSAREWLIRKGRLFYRPNKSGYTDMKSHAGRYTELDALREAEIEPWHMEAIHQDNVPDPTDDINVREISSLKAALAEHIVAVAARYAGLTITLPAPARHSDLLRPLFDATGTVLSGDDQGFLTNTGRFVSRFEAAKLAVRARQIVEPQWPPDLYSEDLW